jgi:hypothetical protein
MVIKEQSSTRGMTFAIFLLKAQKINEMAISIPPTFRTRARKKASRNLDK